MPSKKFASTRTTGLIIAGAVALIIAGIVLVVAVSSRGMPKPVPQATGDVTDIDVSALVRGTETGAGAFQDAKDGRLQFEDRNNPSRLQAELIYRRTNPIGGGFYDLDEPRAWIYLKDGRAIYVRADTGRVKMPNRSNSPESGQFVGNVVALLYPPRAEEMSGKPRDPMVDVPALVARTSAIRFDTQLLEFASEDRVTIETPDARFAGTGVLVRGNQVLDRIEYMKVARDGVIRYRIAPREHSNRAGAVTAAVGASPAPAKTGSEPTWEIVEPLDIAALFNHGLEAPDGPRDAGGTAPVLPIADRSAPGDPANAPAAPASERNDTDSASRPIHPAAAVAAARAAQQQQPQAPPQKEDLYEAVFADTVRVAQRSRELAADTLFVWLRTLDNKLPAGAFGATAAVAGADPRGVPLTESTPCGLPPLNPLAALSAALLAATQSTSEWPPILFTDGEADLVLTWAGPLAVRPIAVAPPPRELSGGNHLALRFSSRADGGEPFVRLRDAEINARGGCDELEYLATSRDMTLTSGPGSPRVWFGAPEAGCLTGRSIHVNLSTGVAEIPSDGALATLERDSAGSAMDLGSDGLPAWLAAPKQEYFARTIDWRRRADMQFRTRDGEIRDALEWAEFRGDSFATDTRSSLGADMIRAEFIEAGASSTVLKRLSAEGSVEALAAGWRRPEGVEVDLTAGGFGEGLLKAQRLDVSFQPSTSRKGDVDPTYLLARGEAIVGKDNASLRGERLEASMQRDAGGDIAVTDFEARGSGQTLARFDRGDGVWATGERIKGHAQRQTASVIGPRVRVARGPSLIESTIVELDGLARRMDVYAPGTFTHDQPTAALTGPAAGTVHVTANWMNSMTFDDAAGILECRGDATVVKSEPLSLDTVRAERIRVDLTTDAAAGNAVAEVPTGGPSAASASALQADVGDRRVIRATAFGSIQDRADGKPATVESRAYAPPPQPGASRALETISYLESAQIVANDQKGTIETPVAGRAVVFDQRSPDATSQDDQRGPSDGLVAGSPRGTSSFRWEGSMVFTRESGMLDLLERIEVVHKPLDGRPLTRMTSDRLQAKLDLLGGGSGGGRLVYAEAIGSVYAESGPQRLVGDRVMYDARMGTAVATAAQSNSVTLYDDRRAAPFTARRLKWDLVRDQVEILEPATVVAPR